MFAKLMGSFEGADGHFELDGLDASVEGQPGTIFGGCLLAIVLRAAGLKSTVSRPISSACQFLRPAVIGQPLRVDVVTMKRGRTSELLAVSVRQLDKLVVEAQIRAAEGGDGPDCEPVTAPPTGDPHSTPLFADSMSADGSDPPGVLNWCEVRGSSESREPVLWTRVDSGVTSDAPFLEAARWALALDSQGGALMHRLGMWGEGRADLPWGFSSLDSHIHFHEPAGSPWVLTKNEVLTASGGFAGVRTLLWSSDGALLASAMSQVAFFALPEGWSYLRDRAQ
jgi:acyl-CoA thioesterase